MLETIAPNPCMEASKKKACVTGDVVVVVSGAE